MKISKLVGERTKETPSGIVIKSHGYLVRGGFIKQVTQGIYTLLPAAKRITRKIENIIREEMDAVDGQEVLFPVVMPREMWDESGRYSSIGDEMVRFKDRVGHDMLLGMTHEEAAVHMAKNIVKSYEQLPFMVYQIQTKFRDEPRSRGGLIRVREFTMKDAYSFHLTKEDMNKYYNEVHKAYYRIFKRIGMKNVVDVKSDTGMMGGKVAHEFMLVTPVGEDSLVLCKHCGYRANMEVANSIINTYESSKEELKEVYTGKAKEISEVCELLKIQPYQTCKAVCYAVKGDESKIVVVFVRGDLEVNEVKLKNVSGYEVVACSLEDTELTAGNIGPIGLPKGNIEVFYDKSLENENCLVIGANKDEYHFTGFCPSRDIENISYVDVRKVSENDKCAICGNPISLERGIEIGNIFQLETKYTKVMNMTVHNEKGEEVNPIMACYGIGVGRALASIAEEKADDKGLIWPISIAPWHVYLCPLRIDDERVKTLADEYYEKLTTAGIEVLYDDRNVSPGVKFADSELMGIPVRVIISPKGIENDQAEILIRETGEKIFIPFNQLFDKVKEIIETLKNNI